MPSPNRPFPNAEETRQGQSQHLLLQTATFSEPLHMLVYSPFTDGSCKDPSICKFEWKEPSYKDCVLLSRESFAVLILSLIVKVHYSKQSLVIHFSICLATITSGHSTQQLQRRRCSHALQVQTIGSAQRRVTFITFSLVLQYHKSPSTDQDGRSELQSHCSHCSRRSCCVLHAGVCCGPSIHQCRHRERSKLLE